MRIRDYDRNVTMQLTTKTQPTIIVRIWSVFAGQRRSIGAWRVLVLDTLRPPSRTWRSTSTIRAIAEESVRIIIIVNIRPRESNKKSFFCNLFCISEAYMASCSHEIYLLSAFRILHLSFLTRIYRRYRTSELYFPGGWDISNTTQTSRRKRYW